MKQRFGSIQTDRLHPQLHFAFARLARGQFFEFQILGTADAVETNDLRHVSY
jgi:hypothetical protein